MRLTDDHYCFACGSENPVGLRLLPDRGEGRCEIRWTPRREHQGFQDILHGGIISTLLDEAMAHAVLSVIPGAATASLVVTFKKPVRPGREVTVRAVVAERKGRVLRTTACLLQDGEEKAAAEAKFVVIRAESSGGPPATD
jgi:uncharacterized protein (TIGR00369 family)